MYREPRLFGIPFVTTAYRLFPTIKDFRSEDFRNNSLVALADLQKDDSIANKQRYLLSIVIWMVRLVGRCGLNFNNKDEPIIQQLQEELLSDAFYTTLIAMNSYDPNRLTGATLFTYITACLKANLYWRPMCQLPMPFYYPKDVNGVLLRAWLHTQGYAYTEQDVRAYARHKICKSIERLLHQAEANYIQADSLRSLETVDYPQRNLLCPEPQQTVAAIAGLTVIMRQMLLGISVFSPTKESRDNRLAIFVSYLQSPSFVSMGQLLGLSKQRVQQQFSQAVESAVDGLLLKGVDWVESQLGFELVFSTRQELIEKVYRGLRTFATTHSGSLGDDFYAGLIAWSVRLPQVTNKGRNYFRRQITNELIRIGKQDEPKV